MTTVISSITGEPTPANEWHAPNDRADVLIGPDVGPRQRNRIKKAVRDFMWRAKAVRELSGVRGGDEYAADVSDVFGGQANPGALRLFSEVCGPFDFTATAKNAAKLAEAIESARARIVLPIRDNRRSPDEESERRAAMIEAEAERRAESESKAAKVAARAAELRTVYPLACSADGLSDHARVAKNIRRELRDAFPGVKFSVRSDSFSGGDSVDIRWSLGPSSGAVEKITAKYQQGSFNGMIDLYEYDDSIESRAVAEVLGQVKYVSPSREIPEHIRETIGRSLCECYGVEFENLNQPSPQPCNGSGRGYLSEDVYRVLCCIDCPPHAEPIGLERIPADEPDNNGLPFRPTFDAAPDDAAEDGDDDDGGRFTVTEIFHTRRGHEVWIVSDAERVEREIYDTRKARAAELGGKWSRKWSDSPAGFAFDDKAAADRFAAELRASI
jgi:hypothetical protein